MPKNTVQFDTEYPRQKERRFYRPTLYGTFWTP